MNITSRANREILKMGERGTGERGMGEYSAEKEAESKRRRM